VKPSHMPQGSYRHPALTQPPRFLRLLLRVAVAVLLVLCTDALISPVSTIAGAAVFTFTNLASTNNSSKYGEPVTFIANVFWEGSVGTPMGTVNFTDGTKVLGNVSLDSNCRAAFTTSSLAAGSHYIAATYLPADPLVFSGSSTTFTQKVTSTTAITGLYTEPECIWPTSDLCRNGERQRRHARGYRHLHRWRYHPRDRFARQQWAGHVHYINVDCRQSHHHRQPWRRPELPRQQKYADANGQPEYSTGC